MDVVALAEVAETVAREAAALLAGAVRDRPAGTRPDADAKSSPTDWVTEWDRAAEVLVRRRLAELRPGDGVLGEEEGDVAGTTGVRWVVDPLDGTTNFVYGLPPYAVSIAAQLTGGGATGDGSGGTPAVAGGPVVAGAVADVAHGEVYVAARGRGATRDGVPIGPSACRALPLALVGTGFSYDPDRRGRQGEVVARVLPRVRDIRRAGAAAVDLCWVACGRLDAFWERGLGPWDLAAGGLIAAEAGAVVTDLAGGPASAAMMLAATPAIADPLRALLADAGAALA